MSLNQLTALVTLPEDPIEAGPADRWPKIQDQVGTILPVDFRDFGLAFGTGKFVQLGIFVFNPFAAIFPQWLEEALGVWRSLKSGEGDREVPYGVFPESPGLFPWGVDEAGTGMFWLTEGIATDWPILIRGEDAKYHRFQMALTTFLAKLFGQEIVLPRVWPKRKFKNRSNLAFTPLNIRPNAAGPLKTIYELYAANGMRAGFWVEHQIWAGTSDRIRVKSVSGQTEGPLTGEPPNYDEGPVLIDVYVDGKLRDENQVLTIAGDRGFRIMETPEWWKV